MHPPTALLYDAHQQCWLAFHQPLTILTAHHPAEVQPLLEQVQSFVEQGQFAAGFVSYESAPAFDRVLAVRPSEANQADFPFAWFSLYAAVEPITLPSVATLPDLPILDWQATITPGEYEQAIAQIKAYIQRGDTYQVNFSFRLRAPFAGDAWAYFVRMVHNQRCTYGAWIDMPDWTICSSSPELFFQQVGSELLCRPMKGTVRRALTAAADQQAAQWLHQSEKNRAENVMIVDMVRNDFAQIAQLGSVQVPQLFTVEQYPTLWQMTSDVTCRSDASLGDLFCALFPPASITGAPKPRTMQIIAELETTPRRIYTGTIGMLLPEGRSQWNVAIRTVLIHKPSQTAEYGLGSGVVWDSQTGDEFAECYTKAQVLTQLPVEFSLLETMLWQPTAGYFLLDLHLARLQASARYFARPIDLEAITAELEAIAQTLPPHHHKIRLLLSPDGALTLQSAPVLPSPTHPLRLHLASTPVDSNDLFLYHKTTHRQVYDRALQNHPQADDVLLWNENGELTESCRANLVVEWNGDWLTPPIRCGLLAGTFRQWLLNQGKLQERLIYREDLVNCSQIWLINSVRQWQRAELIV
jgi:para-aminobenzoate synthetase / 4-amino-4-deoxychorismate lyase